MGTNVIICKCTRIAHSRDILAMKLNRHTVVGNNSINMLKIRDIQVLYRSQVTLHSLEKTQSLEVKIA